ncbi:thioredoxin-like protein [Trichoderma chlorosporum]
MSASPVIGVPSQQHQPGHHFHSDQHRGMASPQPARQPLPSSGRKPTTMTSTATAAMRRDRAATGGRGAGGLIRLEIYVDLLCPWCFIEKHSLEALMQRYTEEHPEVRFEVTWKPYYIAPTMGKHNVEKRSIYDRLNARNPNFLARIQVVGAKYDIAFSIRGVTGNTRTAHRLIALALHELGPAGQSRVVESLFQGHFEDGRDISDEAWLVGVGAAAGIPEAVVRLALEDEDAGRRVDAMAEAARDVIGVEATPCVMVQGRYKVGGYQENQVFESLFEKIRLAGEAF